jgi:pterin-4a-carbinolamine dehydratase
MTPQERMARAAVVETEMQTARERLTVALRTMDYERALDFQKQIARLEREARQLAHPRRGRTFKVRPAASS